jgi:malic enzyme
MTISGHFTIYGHLRCADTIVALLMELGSILFIYLFIYFFKTKNTQKHLGLTAEEARAKFWLIDSKGLITTNRGDTLAGHKLPYARTDMDSIGGGGQRMGGAEADARLLAIIQHVQPHMLMGLAGSGPAFKEAHVRELLKFVAKPVIFPLSNPTSKAEISAVDAYTWTNGQCIFAAGSPPSPIWSTQLVNALTAGLTVGRRSPFDPVELNGQTYYPGQGNNMFIFPGVGFGAWLAQASKVTYDEVLF